MQKSQVFESTIADLHRMLYPDAIITWNKKIVGKSGVERQIDVFIEDNSGVYPIKIVVDCKLHISKLNINDVEATWMLVNDVRANLGIIICNNGYTQGAIKRAKDIGLLKLCLAVVPGQKEFSAKLAMPMLAQKVELKSIIEVYPKSLIPIMRKLELEEIALENIKYPVKVKMRDFIVSRLDKDIANFSREKVIEVFNREYNLYVNKEYYKFSKIIIRCVYIYKLVVGYSLMKDGKGIFEVSDKDEGQVLCIFSQGQALCNFLIGSQLSTNYSIKELNYWTWRDFDPKKDFPLCIATDFEEINTFFETEQHFI